MSDQSPAAETAATATREQIAATVMDGWRLKCNCLYLFLAGQPEGTPTTLIVPTHKTLPRVCGDFHDAL